MSIPSPIALFAFNRPDHLHRTLEALAANELAAESDLTIFCDGPRTEADVEKTEAVRAVVHAAGKFASVAVVYREHNWGLAKSIISGVTEMVDAYGRVIVMEDDLVTSPFFLRYMNDALRVYKNVPHVASIHAWTFQNAVQNPPKTFFLQAMGCWGWATWKRAWDDFNPDGTILLQRLIEKNLQYAFDVDGQYPYTNMLKAQVDGLVDSWAIRWYASNFLLGRLTLHPGRSLIRHIGMDSSGRHCGTTDLYSNAISERPIDVNPIEPTVHAEMHAAYRSFFSRVHRENTLKRRIRACLPSWAVNFLKRLRYRQ